LCSYGIELLDELLKGNITEQQYDDKYNTEFDAVTDFVSTYYKYCKNSNEYWDHFKTLNIEKHRPNGIFPPRSWNLILAGMGQEEKKHKIDAMRALKICRGNVKYNKWLEDFHAKHATPIPV
jgi:hypothetical protein